jgi:hypothetical protein
MLAHLRMLNILYLRLYDPCYQTRNTNVPPDVALFSSLKYCDTSGCLPLLPFATFKHSILFTCRILSISAYDLSLSNFSSQD